MRKIFQLILLSLSAGSAQATEILIACEYNKKVFMGIVDTSNRGLQRIFGHEAYIKQHNKGFLRVSIQMEAETRDIIFSGRSGAMSYNSGEIDQRVNCTQEALIRDEIKSNTPNNRAANVEENHDYLWYFDKEGLRMGYVTDKP